MILVITDFTYDTQKSLTNPYFLLISIWVFAHLNTMCPFSCISKCALELNYLIRLTANSFTAAKLNNYYSFRVIYSILLIFE